MAPTAGTPLQERELVALWLLGRVPASVMPWPLLRPGRAGRGPGPDIREATAVPVTGVPCSGNVEVHLRASDFTRHGHRGDPAYAQLLAHLVWLDDRTLAERTDPWPTIEAGPAFGLDPGRLRAALRQGPVGAEPCAGAAGRLGPDALTSLIRAEGRRRLAEKSWQAAALAERSGWGGAWVLLLDHALAHSAGRRAELPGQRHALVERITAALATRGAGDPVRHLAALASGSPAALIEELRGRQPGEPVSAATPAAVGSGRAAEVGWNAALPLLAALASAYGDVTLGRDVARLVEAWPGPRPYGRTRSLAALLSPAAPHSPQPHSPQPQPHGPRSHGPPLGEPNPGASPFAAPPNLAPGASSGARGAAYAQGLLRLQELWCERGGCGACPVSAPAAERGAAEAPPRERWSVA